MLSARSRSGLRRWFKAISAFVPLAEITIECNLDDQPGFKTGTAGRIMMRLFFVLACLLMTGAAQAGDVRFGLADGQVEFVLPSGNIGCIYTQAGGTSVYEPVDGGPELSCDRVEPAYVRAILGPHGKARRFNNVGDASCCGAGNVLGYGSVWREGSFVCTSSQSGLTCKRGKSGFSMARAAVKVW